GGGANGAWLPGAMGAAVSTVVLEGMAPISKIWLQRKLNQPLRTTRQCCPVANCRATASMPNVPLPGTTMAEWALYTCLRVRLISFIAFWKRFDMWLTARSV